MKKTTISSIVMLAALAGSMTLGSVHAGGMGMGGNRAPDQNYGPDARGRDMGSNDRRGYGSGYQGLKYSKQMKSSI